MQHYSDTCHYLLMSRYMQQCSDMCHYLLICPITCDTAVTCVTVCWSVPLHVILQWHVSLFADLYHYMSHCSAICNYLLISPITCHTAVPYVTIFWSVPLHVTLQRHMSLFADLSHYKSHCSDMCHYSLMCPITCHTAVTRVTLQWHVSLMQLPTINIRPLHKPAVHYHSPPTPMQYNSHLLTCCLEPFAVCSVLSGVLNYVTTALNVFTFLGGKIEFEYGIQSKGSSGTELWLLQIASKNTLKLLYVIQDVSSTVPVRTANFLG